MSSENVIEIIGTASNVDIQNGTIDIEITIKKKLQIPIHLINNKKLKDLVGKKIGLLQLDGYHYLREISDDSL